LSAIHDLIAQVSDQRLRERLASEWAAASRNKKFGLVFEDHLPELLPLYGTSAQVGDLVCRKFGPLKDIWTVLEIDKDVAVCTKRLDETRPGTQTALDTKPLEIPLNDLIVVRQFGDPIFPSLIPVDAVANGSPDSPWHTLIEADNYHALQLLDYLYAGQADCIYIDPPYNTGARDWKYNNDYVDGVDAWRHSKWLAFMEKRLRLAKRLLNPQTGVLVVTIDEHEVHHLGMLLEQEFPEAYRQLVTIVITSRGVAKQGLARVEEYALFTYLGAASACSTSDDYLTNDTKARTKSPWASLLRRGTNAAPFDRPGLVYPIFVNPETHEILGVGETLDAKVKRGELKKSELNALNPVRTSAEAWPIRSDGSLGSWQVGPTRFSQLKEKGFVKLGRYDGTKNSWSVNYLKKGPISEIASGDLVLSGYEWDGGPAIVEYPDQAGNSRRAKTVWHRTSHDAGTYGSGMIRSILGSRAFEFPKSIYAVRDTLATIVGNKPDALVIDFFAGSGTTLNALNLLNSTDGGSRRCILITNNEVSAEEAQDLKAAGAKPGDDEWESQGICRSVTWPRSKFTICGKRDDGTPLQGDYLSGRMKEIEKERDFKHISFVDQSSLSNTTKKKQIVASLTNLPQSLVKAETNFIVSPKHSTSILFNSSFVEDWIAELDENDHLSELLIIAESKKLFDEIKKRVSAELGPIIVNQEEKRPMRQGFEANLAYFRLGFLDKNKIALKHAFREILPLLWLKAGAVGARPEFPPSPYAAPFFIPEASNFAVLLDETRINKFIKVVEGCNKLAFVYIVTDAEESFRAMSARLNTTLVENNPRLEIVQLYRDYLENFMINKRHADSATTSWTEEAR